jgi:hypothetical protein
LYGIEKVDFPDTVLVVDDEAVVLEVLELRVRQATADLRRERDQLLHQLGSGASRTEAEIIGLEMALLLVQDLSARPGLDVGPVRGELQRVVRHLESHIRGLRGPQAA